MSDAPQIDLSKLTLEEKLQLLDLLKVKDIERKRNWLATFVPNPKQMEFYEAGVRYRQRMFMASNQSGKTMGAGCELAYHVTGRYPKVGDPGFPNGWQGLRVGCATQWIVGSESFELNKKGCQKVLIGPPANEEEWGTGAIPYECIKRITRQIGTQDAISSIVVKHISGEDSIISFASYDQGRTKWQADTVFGVWFDEEPPLDVFQEGLTRTNVSGGPIMLTFTPLLGMSAVVKLFMPIEGLPHRERTIIKMTIDDALHYSAERRAAIVDQYDESEKEARVYGRPMMGSGLVFPVSRTAIEVQPFKIPPHFKRIAGIDFGWDHPTGVAWCLYDEDTDTFYVYRTYRQRKATVTTHAQQFLGQHPWIPVAWPHDGYVHDKGSGKAIKDQYMDAGVKMLPVHATWGSDKDKQNYAFQPGIDEMLDRMQTGRFKVFSTCEEFFQEVKGYHMVDGKVIKIDDDVISAARVALMMRRHAKSTQMAMMEGRTKQFGMGPGMFPKFGVLDQTTGY